MAKFNRRRLLVSGLTTGIAGATIAQAVQAQPSRPNPAPTGTEPTDEPIEAIFGEYDDSSASPGKPTAPVPDALTRPTITYDRDISRLLIQCSRLGMEQFEQGQRAPGFNGSIQSLKSYSSNFDRYTQVASFQVTLDATTTLLPNLGTLGNRIVRRVINPTRAFMGFALTSATHNIIVFRGTSNPKEWIANFQVRQSEYTQAGKVRGRVHTGFLRLYEQLAVQVRRIAPQLNPAIPCYVTGHSLGGALATLAIADLAHNAPSLQQQLQLYSYAAPRVGDLSFAQFFSTIAPNSYRIVNLTDIVPMVPPAQVKGQQYSHIGQKWVFLDYGEGDVALSHALSLYQMAIEQQVETNQLPTFPTACG